MMKLLATVLVGALTAAAQYKLEPAGPPPPELAPAMAEALVRDGIKLVDAKGSVVCEVWFRITAPAGGHAEENATLETVPHGAFLGAMRFTSKGADRRGQTIKPGVYTLRYSLYPINGDHQGVAPQRDFLVLLRAEDDKDMAHNFAYKALMAEALKASGTPHPLCLSFWKEEPDSRPGFERMGEHDWVLRTRLGDIPIGLILIGEFAG